MPSIRFDFDELPVITFADGFRTGRVSGFAIIDYDERSLVGVPEQIVLSADDGGRETRDLNVEPDTLQWDAVDQALQDHHESRIDEAIRADADQAREYDRPARGTMSHPRPLIAEMRDLMLGGGA